MNENTNYNQSTKFELDIVTGRLTAESATRYFSLVGWFMFTMAIVIEVVIAFICTAVMLVYPDLAYHFAFSDAVSFISIYAIALPCALPIIRKLPCEKPIPVSMSPGKIFVGLCICVAFMTLGSNISQTFLTVVENAFGTTTENPVAISASRVPWWFDIATTVILAPILEEILFRRILCSRLAPLGEGFAIIISSAFFAMIHGNFYQVFYAFLMGAFLAFIYLKTGKLRYTIFYHIAINFFFGFVAPMIVEHVDFEALYSGNIEAITANMLPLLLLLAYEGLILSLSLAGIILIIVKRKEFIFHKGILMPPEKWAGSVFLNGGMAAAIAILVLNMVWSLI